jgi:antibiotic biosynthesis monooxygenase (ABM) superfamily enzyme
MIRYVELFNFLPGGRAEYQAWAEQINARLIEQPELRSITVSENALFTTPHRVVELEFDDLASMERYFERPEVREIYLEWATRCTEQTSLVLRTVAVKAALTAGAEAGVPRKDDPGHGPA